MIFGSLDMLMFANLIRTFVCVVFSIFCVV